MRRIIAGVILAELVALQQTEQAFAQPAATAFELPDPTLTPGQVDSSLTAADICNGQGTRLRRNVTAATRTKVLRDYSTAALDSYEFESDHLVLLIERADEARKGPHGSTSGRISRYISPSSRRYSASGLP